MIAKFIKHDYVCLGQPLLVDNTSLFNRRASFLRHLLALKTTSWSTKIDLVYNYYGVDCVGVRSVSTMLPANAVVGDTTETSIEL